MSIVAWIAFGMIAGYTVVPMVPVDEELGTVGHVALGSVAAVIGGLIGIAIVGADPLGPRIDLLSVVTAVLGAIVAIVGWNRRRGPLARGRGF